jgi:large subunit ribosomal protein L6
MSRIGKLPVKITEGVVVSVEGRTVKVTGPKGVSTLALPLKINVEVKDGFVNITRVSEDKKVKACHGAIRAHINNMVQGVVTPWKKELEIRGTGYKFAVNGNKLTVTAGFIHPVIITAPEGVTFAVAEDTKLSVTGHEKVVVGQVASNIRKIRTPEPYKGKGIRYLNEFIKLKAGKTAKA